MARSKAVTRAEDITRAILVLRGQKVLLDAELAALYGVTTARLNQQVRRNRKRFPADFFFELTPPGVRQLEDAFCNIKLGRPSHTAAFTEHGAIQDAAPR